jgi:Ca2+-binding RTX toxin-like protein
VENALDVVVEAAGEGTDTVRTTLANYTLGANVENLTFIGAGSFVGTGNELANTIAGGVSNDIIEGGAGNDNLSGGGGDDVFVFNTGFGDDRLQGFDGDPTSGQDLLDISSLGVTAVSFNSDVIISDAGLHTLVTLGDDSILLVGVADHTTISSADFILAG